MTVSGLAAIRGKQPQGGEQPGKAGKLERSTERRAVVAGDRLQRPDALHAMVIPGHLKVVDRYLSDLAASVDHVRVHPELAETGEAATYGMIAHLPLRKMVRRQVRDMFAATYQISGGEIDLSGGSALEGAGAAGEAGTGSESSELPSLIQKAVNWYIRRAQKKG